MKMMDVARDLAFPSVPSNSVHKSVSKCKVGRYNDNAHLRRGIR